MVKRVFKSSAFVLLVMIMNTGLYVSAKAGPLQSLEPFLWENRLILIAANSDQSTALKTRLEAADHRR